jgi:polysaccharide pyruvyl transferase WcaK-like protein
MDEQSTTRICLLESPIEASNLGVSALTRSAIHLLLQGHPQAEITLLNYGKESTTTTIEAAGGSVELRLVNMRFSKNILDGRHILSLLLAAVCWRLLPWRRFRNRLLSANSCLQTLSQADLVGAISGGDSFSDLYGIRRFLYVCLPQVLALILKRPLVLLPQTLGPFQKSAARMLARWILKRARKVYVRGQDNLELVSRLCYKRPDNVTFCHDMAFCLPSLPPSPESFGSNNVPPARLIGLNVSGLLWMGGYTNNNMFGLKLNYRSLMEKIMRYFLSQPQTVLLLIAHVGGTSRETDGQVCDDIYKRYVSTSGDRLKLVPWEKNPCQIKGILGLCEFVIASRMHACIGALSQCRPAFGIAYSDKFKDVMSSVGVAGLAGDARQLSESEIFSQLIRAYEERGVWEQRLMSTIPAIHENLRHQFRQLILDVSSPNSQYNNKKSLKQRS